MLRQLASRVARIGSRGISTTAARLEGEAAPAGLKEFSEAWTATAPSTMAVPDVNSTFLKQAGDGQSLADGDRFPVNFYTPYGVIAESKVGFANQLQPSICWQQWVWQSWFCKGRRRSMLQSHCLVLVLHDCTGSPLMVITHRS